MRLVYDTETTGLIRFNLRSADPSQPQIIQLGAALFDMKWNKVSSFVTLIRPDGWTIEREAAGIHGITEERCAAFGVPIAVAMVMFKAMSENALQVLAHNADFDRRVVNAQLARLGVDDLWWRNKAQSMACTMLLSTDACALPKADGRGAKWPKLEEAIRHFYPGDAYVAAHDAEADLLATARVAQALEREGLLPPPARPGAPFQRMTP